MLQCSCCDYLKTKFHSGGEAFFECHFSGHVFEGETGFELSEYPCHDISYASFLRAVAGRETKEEYLPLTPADQEDRKEKRVQRLTGNDWRLIYLRGRRRTA